MAFVLFIMLATCVAAGRTASAQPDGISVSLPAGSVKSDGSVLERFRLYKGERTPEALSSLFTAAESLVLRQQPNIALSDGKTAVILAIKLPAVDKVAPSFSVRNAAIVSMQQKPNSEWVLNVLPTKGSLETVLMVSSGTKVQEYPVTVTPELPTNVQPVLTSFKEYLNSPAGECTKTSDLNADGVCDYLDDYIYTANYLIKESMSGRSKDARRQRALQRTLKVPTPNVPPDPGSGVVIDPKFEP